MKDAEIVPHSTGYTAQTYDRHATRSRMSRAARKLVVPTLHADVCDPEARRRLGELYRWAPLRTMESALQFCQHVQAALLQVTAPALILAALHDHVMSVSDALVIYLLLGSRAKRLVIFPRSAHVLLKDYDREAVFANTAAFIARQAREATTVI